MMRKQGYLAVNHLLLFQDQATAFHTALRALRFRSDRWYQKARIALDLN